jgi:predicted nucleotidyltransferase
MKLKYYSVGKLKKEIAAIADRHLDSREYRLFFFGSRVRGDNFPRADIDIGIEGPEKIPAPAKLKIKEDLDRLHILYKIDFVDFRNVSKEFRKEALQYVEYVQ